ncbi:DUF2505 domain-containing protein [Demequina sp. TTPB684]|uniref:DUF2505 domain-containing protein n=1 Tax=unclassified Demequina TaxID=2620311 RepID=UPI001CF4D0C5|nr:MULTISPECIES: DUF2505 domain-containing protein [unclassified Demequina]MCB2412095.1 DUF2505 domain-containing protein [Demequina sp. TTPB684]UPU88534.1 DUF2505 domain-containing protein [Demequina sp. TMPB413]
MDITHEHHFTASIEDVVAMFSNEDFAAQRARASGAAGSDVLVDVEEDGSFTVVIRRTLPANTIPAEFRAFVGSEIHVRYTEAWEAPDAREDGVREGTFAMEIPGTPGHARGSVVLTPRGEGTDFEVNGEVQASVPLVGPMVERAIASAIDQALPQELAAADVWLASA